MVRAGRQWPRRHPATIGLIAALLLAILVMPKPTQAVEAQTRIDAVSLRGKMAQKVCVMKQCAWIKERHISQVFVVTAIGATPTIAITQTDSGEQCLNGGIRVDVYVSGLTTEETMTIKATVLDEHRSTLGEVQHDGDVSMEPGTTSTVCFY